jgi:hypothetical protein
MCIVTINYEGEQLTESCPTAATHVVVSRKRDGALRIQPTANPVVAMMLAQDRGDDARRMAPIEEGRAIFTVVPEYDDDFAILEAANRRHLLLEGIAISAVVLCVLIVFLVV